MTVASILLEVWNADLLNPALSAHLTSVHQEIHNVPLGDFDGNGILDATDIDALTTEVRAGTNDSSFDVNSDGSVDGEDRTVWVNDLRNTFFGDSNLDGEFSSSDFVAVFTIGEYEDEVVDNSGWQPAIGTVTESLQAAPSSPRSPKAVMKQDLKLPPVQFRNRQVIAC